MEFTRRESRYLKHTADVMEEFRLAKENGKLEETATKIFLEYKLDMKTLWCCRQYAYELPEEYLQKYPTIRTILALLEAMAGRVENAQNVISVLGKTPKELNPSELTPDDFVRLMCELILPQYDNYEFARRAFFLAACLKQPVMGLALTACRPSVINGFRDMTEFCLDMEEKQDEYCHAIDLIYGSSGKGVYDVALAEWKYETGDDFKALMLLAGTIPTLEDCEDIRCLFAAYMLQMRILIFGGQTKTSHEIFNMIREKVVDKYYDELEDSLNAAECLYYCYEGNHEEIKNWLENKAPDENGDIFMMDMYCYLVKMRCYLQTGKYMLTLILAKKMINYLKQGYRPHDLCECYMMAAMACLKAGDKKSAIEEFEHALEIGKKYRYVRVFADEGQMALELLNLMREKYKKAAGTEPGYSEDWLKQIKGVALMVANRYPDYLKTEQEEYAVLTKTEKQIIVMMASGLKNDDIAYQLGVKLRTVKFHTGNIFEKLKVQNRQQAINRAREIGYL